MSIMSQFTFQKNFNNATFLTKNQALKDGVSSTNFSKADTDGNGKIDIDEILANDTICSNLLGKVEQTQKLLEMTKSSIRAVTSERKDIQQKIFEEIDFDNIKDIENFKPNIEDLVAKFTPSEEKEFPKGEKAEPEKTPPTDEVVQQRTKNKIKDRFQEAFNFKDNIKDVEQFKPKMRFSA